MAPFLHRLNGYAPSVNLVALVVTVAVLWWRIARVEDETRGLRAAVAALQVEVAQQGQALRDRP